MNKKGSVFILFLWVMLLLALFAMSAGFRTRLATKIEGYTISRFEMGYDFLAAVNLARYFIESDGEPLVDFTQDDWFGVPKEFSTMKFSERFELEIVDEESKVNLNLASEQLLISLFEVLKRHEIKLEADPKDLSAGILGWRGASYARGKSTLGTQVKRAPFESLEELRLIESISRSDFEAIEPFVTVYGMIGGVMRVNINTAHPYVLEALIWSLSGGDFSKRELLTKIEKFRSGEESGTKITSGAGQVFRQEDLRPEIFMVKLKIGSSPTNVRLVSQFLNFVTVDSRFFSVQVRSKLPKNESFGVKAVLGPKVFHRFGGGELQKPSGRFSRPVANPLEILSWREGIHIESAPASSR